MVQRKMENRLLSLCDNQDRHLPFRLSPARARLFFSHLQVWRCRVSGRELVTQVDILLVEDNPGDVARAREVLAGTVADDDLKGIPVVAVATSPAEEDALESYSHHGRCHVTKSVDLNRFIQVVRSVESFLQSIVGLPPKEVTE
jgi:hypothetical protein